MTNSFFGRERLRQVRPVSFSPVIFLAPPLAICGAAMADPTLPTIGSTVYNVTASNASIDGGLTASTGATAASNAAVINAFITYASSHGGGTVEIPTAASAYLCNQLTLASSVNLQVDTGATLQNGTPSSTLITTSGTTHDIEISGGGTLDDHATSTSSNNMLSLQNITNLWVRNVTIENSSHEHLVPEKDTNVTIDGVTIQDPLGYLSNADGIDYSGSHFLIENCNIADGDDNIVAKAGPTFCSDITIKNCVIGAGHGISVGGQTNSGLNGMTVTNCTFNGTDNGFRLKAGIPNGGIVQNVSFSNSTMTNVKNPIIINSWYNGQDHYGSGEIPGTSLEGNDPQHAFNPANPGDPPVTVDEVNNTDAYPFFDNISFSNINATCAGNYNVAIIYGLNSTPADSTDQPPRNIDSISFSNVNLIGDPSGSWGADIYYASNLDLSGLNVTATNSPNFEEYGDTFVPEPATASVALLGWAGLLLCRQRRKPAHAPVPLSSHTASG